MSVSLYDDDDTSSSDSDFCGTSHFRSRCHSWDVLHKLTVVVVYTVPWAEQPGALKNRDSHTINGPPANAQLPVTAGMPWCIRLAAQPTTLGRPVERRLDLALPPTIPSGWNSVYNVPNVVFQQYGNTLKNATSFTFDFGSRRRIKNSCGKILAYGKGGDVQASVSFSYDWSTNPAHEDAVPVFEITKCTSANARFVLLGSPSDFIPDCDSECFFPVVVLSVQQSCCECDAGEDCDCVPDAGGPYEPTSCAAGGLDCVTLRQLQSTCRK